MALQSDHEFAPTEIARAAFPTAFRGYDQDAVRRYLSRLAAALEHQQTFEDLGDLEARGADPDRVDELEAEILALQEEIRELETELVQRSVDQADEGSRRTADVVEFDEARAIELLGQETARVLESARSAAADILKRAENQASALKADAKKELTEARRRAKKMVADRRAEAEAAIDELTAEAERSANRVTAEAEEHREAVVAESSRILTDAEARAEAEQREAESRARQTVADAEALRRRVVAELVADRRVAQADLDRMIEARDRLALSLAVVRGELDGLADQLVEVGSGSGRDDRDGAGEADDAEVARLIERLEAERDGIAAEPAATTTSASDQSDTGVDADHSDDADSSDDADDRRSIVDEPTQEMPAVSISAEDEPGSDATDDEPAAEEPEPAAEVDEGPASLDDDEDPTVPPISNGVFDGDDDDLIDLRHDTGDDPAEGGDDEDELGLDLDDDPDLDADLVGASPDDLNPKPAHGIPLSLVEGFSTIVLNDEDDGSSRAVQGEGSTRTAEPPPRAKVERAPVGTLLDVDPDADPATVITTVAARIAGRSAKGTRGDLVIDEPFTDRLPDWFGARDVAITRSEANLRRQLRRALNDDQSEVLDRLRSGRGRIEVDELQDPTEQRDHFLAPLRRGLTDVARAGARAGGGDDVADGPLDNLIEQLAAYVVDRVRVPTVNAIEEADHDDREKILEPVRAVYRDFRNIGLPELVADALNEGFAIGLYDSIGDGSPILWAIDPRTDPDPVCEVNRGRTDLVKGETFPSGHVRPLAVPGCRCLVIGLH